MNQVDLHISSMVFSKANVIKYRDDGGDGGVDVCLFG